MTISYKYGMEEVKALGKAAGQAQAQFELKKMQLEQNFQLEAQARSKMWELEKMEIASRNDFLQAEQERLEKKQEFNLGIKSIDDAVSKGWLTPEQAKTQKANLQLKHIGLESLPSQEITPYQKESLALREKELAAKQPQDFEQAKQALDEWYSQNPDRTEEYQRQLAMLSMKSAGYSGTIAQPPGEPKITPPLTSNRKVMENLVGTDIGKTLDYQSLLEQAKEVATATGINLDELLAEQKAPVAPVVVNSQEEMLALPSGTLVIYNGRKGVRP
jgi:hypothetical protein